MTKILVIEDEPSIREELADWLQLEGYKVYEAADGCSGLAAAETHLPDLIICDIHMPKMDGYTVLLEMRANPRLNLVPFIFLTANVTRDSIREGMNLGADDYLTKPFTHAEIMNAVQSRLEKQRTLQTHVQGQLELMEQALAEQQHQQRLRSQLVGMFSHDFRNPLSIISSSVHLLKHYGDKIDSERLQKKLDQIDASAKLLNGMLDDMMLSVKLDSGQFEYQPTLIDLNELVEYVVFGFHEMTTVSHRIIFETTLHQPVLTDYKLMQKITANLLSNAVKYSPAGSEIQVGLYAKGAFVELRVQDSGMGVPDEDLPLIFEPFHRTSNSRKIEGTGLGLVIVKQAVALCGGRVTVASKLNEGSTFTVWLPLTPD